MNKQTMQVLNMMCFWTSAAVLAAATICGVLRRCFGIEPGGFLTGAVLPVLMAAAVGYLTNWLAILLLFRPYRPVRWLGGLQGMIPKKQSVLAETLARDIPDTLMPADRIAIRIRRKIRESMQGPELAEQIRGMVADHIRDGRRRKELADRIGSVLDMAGTTGLEEGLTPSGIRRFYHSCGAGFVREKVVLNRALRKKILDELKDQVPGLIGEIRADMPGLIAEYMRDNPVKGTVLGLFTGADGEKLPWRGLERAVRNRLSGQEADRQVKQKLAEFESRLDRYLDSPELEADIASWKRNASVGDTFAALRDGIAEKLPDLLEAELLWHVLGEQILPRIRVFLQLQIRRNRETIMEGLDLPGHIRKSILDLKPEAVHQLVARISGEELGMIQLLGFMLGGSAGFLLLFAQ